MKFLLLFGKGPVHSGGFEQITTAVLLGLWSFFLLAGFVLTCIGTYRKYARLSWKRFFFPGFCLFVFLISLTLLNPGYYLDLSNDGWFGLFVRSFVFIFPLALASFGCLLSTHISTRLPGALFIVAGILGMISSVPFLVDSVLKITYGDTTFTQRGLVRLSLPFQQQLGFLRMLAETAALVALLSYIKHPQKDPDNAPVIPIPATPLSQEN